MHKREWALEATQLHNSWRKKVSWWRVVSCLCGSFSSQWHHSTYAACCRHNGVSGNFSWNEKISKVTHKDLEPAWEELFRSLDSQADEFSEKIIASFAEMHREIKGLFYSWLQTFHLLISETEIESLAPRALGNLLAGLVLRQQKVILSARDMIQNLKHDLGYGFYSNPFNASTDILLRIERRDMLGAHDSSWLAGLMRPAYLACNRFHGKLVNSASMA